MTTPTLHAPEHRSSLCQCDCPDCQSSGPHVTHDRPGGWPVEAGTCPSCKRPSHVGTTCDGRTVVNVLAGYVPPVDNAPDLGLLRDERDPEIVTESELRMLWGDR